MRKVFQSLSRGFSGESPEKSAEVLRVRGKWEEKSLLEDDGSPFTDIEEEEEDFRPPPASPFPARYHETPLSPLPARRSISRTISNTLPDNPDSNLLSLLPISDLKEAPFYPLSIPLTIEFIKFLKKDRLGLLYLRLTCKSLLVILDEHFLRFEIFFHGTEDVQEALEGTFCRPNNISINFGFFDRAVIKNLPKNIHSINLFRSAIDDDSLLLIPLNVKIVKLDFCKRITNVGIKNLFKTTKDSINHLTLRGNQNISGEGLQFLTQKITHLCLLDMRPVSDRGFKCLPKSLLSLEITNNYGEMKTLSTFPVFMSITTLEIDGHIEKDTKDDIPLPPNLFSLTLAKHFLPHIKRFPKDLKRLFVTGAADEISENTLSSLPLALEVLNVGRAYMNVRRIPQSLERLSTLISMDQLSIISNFPKIHLLIITGELVSTPRCFDLLPPNLNSLIFHKINPSDINLKMLPKQVKRLNMTFRESIPNMSFADLPYSVQHLTLTFERDSKYLDLDELASLEQLDILELFSISVEDDDIIDAFEESGTCVRLNGVWIKT